MDKLEDLVKSLEPAKTGRTPTSEELTHFVAGLEKAVRADIVDGDKVVLFDPDIPRVSGKEPFTVASSHSLSASESKMRLNFGKFGKEILNRNAHFVDQLANELSVCMGIAPERVADMMNRVRAEKNQAPVIEPDIQRGVYEGTVISQCATQSVLRSGGSNVLLEHEHLDRRPKANAKVQVVFTDGVGKLTQLQAEIGQAAIDKSKEQGKGK